MDWVVKFARSSIGAKAVVALTGAGLVGFVVAHLLGNLQLFAGPEQFNNYAHGLKSLGPLLWAARLGLLGMFVLHIGMAIRLQSMNKAARPVSYQSKKAQASTLASRSMLLGGVTLLLFVLFHLAHYTLGVVDPQFLEYKTAEGWHDAYKMTVIGFQSAPVAGLYIAAMAGLAMHLGHGVSSMFQTLGLNHPRYRPLIRGIGPALAALIFLGFVSIPIAVQLGIISLQGGA
ncbi:MAG: succinate:quinone oxidoreductase [Myxococcales bacterium]|nr:succinate:quinone oxidoreductase [Myxococcales bacterium]